MLTSNERSSPNPENTDQTKQTDGQGVVVVRLSTEQECQRDPEDREYHAGRQANQARLDEDRLSESELDGAEHDLDVGEVEALVGVVRQDEVKDDQEEVMKLQ